MPQAWVFEVLPSLGKSEASVSIKVRDLGT